MKKVHTSISRSVVFMLLIVLMSGSCASDFENIPPSIIIESQPTKKTFVIGEVIEIKTSYNLAENDLRLEWYVNNVLYDVGDDKTHFTIKTTEHKKMIIRHVAYNDAANIFVDFAYDIKPYNKGMYVLNHTNSVIDGENASNIDYLTLDTLPKYQLIAQNLQYNDHSKIGGDIVTAKLYSKVGDQDYLYVVSASKPQLSKIDIYTSTVVADLSLDDDNEEARDLVIIDKDRGILSTSKGLYYVDLENLRLGKKIVVDEYVDDDQYGDLFIVGDNLYAINARVGLVVVSISGKYNPRTFALSVIVGFGRTSDGKLWCASTNRLVYIINPAEDHFGEIVYGTIDLSGGVLITEKWNDWRVGTIAASSADANAVFFAATKHNGEGNKIYKHIVDSPTVSDTPFVVGRTTDTFYGESIKYDPSTNSIIAIYNNTIDREYSFVFYDAVTGVIKYRFDYDTIYETAYPSVLVFDSDYKWDGQ